jgi:hypothetical protein
LLLTSISESEPQNVQNRRADELGQSLIFLFISNTTNFPSLNTKNAHAAKQQQELKHNTQRRKGFIIQLNLREQESVFSAAIHISIKTLDVHKPNPKVETRNSDQKNKIHDAIYANWLGIGPI